MNTVIFRTVVPGLTALMMVFSIFVLLRGHNEPGGGFIGGLIGASGIAIYGIACGVAEIRKAMGVHPTVLAGMGVFLAGLSGLVSLVTGDPYLTGLWLYLDLGGTEVAISTPLFFDIGVYLVVVGSVAGIALALEDDESKV